MRRHIDVQADWRRSWTYGRVPTPYVGFFNVPVQAPTQDQPFYVVIKRNRPIQSPFTTRWDMEDTFRTSPPGPKGGQSDQ